MEALNDSWAHTGVVFSDTEYRQYLARVREKMRAEGLHALLVTYHSNLSCLIGCFTFGNGNRACLVLPLEGDLTLQACSLEIPAAVVNAFVRDIAIPNWQLQYSGRFGAGEQIAEIVRSKGLATRRLGVEMAQRGLLASVYKALKDHLAEAPLVDASMVDDELTYIKSPVELDCMRQAGEYTVAGIEGSYAAASSGVMDAKRAHAAVDDEVHFFGSYGYGIGIGSPSHGVEVYILWKTASGSWCLGRPRICPYAYPFREISTWLSVNQASLQTMVVSC